MSDHDNDKTYEVHGTVTGREGRPVRGARVVVWAQHIRKRLSEDGPHWVASGRCSWA